MAGTRSWVPLALIVLPVAGACRIAEPARPTDPTCTLVRDGPGPAGTALVKAETVVTGLEVPWAIAFLPGGEILVTERPGRIRLVRKGELSAPVATVETGKGGEGGLLGLALHPDFAKTRWFYVHLTKSDTGSRTNRVERWKLADDATRATFDRVILDGIPGAEFHDGGRLRFGPDGMLYVGTGDARVPALSRNPASLAGKILRVTPDGDVPKDNPSSSKAAFVTGIRNTQGFDWFDDGSLAVTDHGPSGELGRRGHDEITVARRGDDLGWPDAIGCTVAAGTVSPSIAFEEAAPPGGAAFYRGDAIPAWKGSLLVGSLGARHLHRVVFDTKDRRRVASHEVYFRGDPPSGFGRLRDVVMGPDGHLYLTTSNCDGRGDCPADKDRILRVVPSAAPR